MPAARTHEPAAMNRLMTEFEGSLPVETIERVVHEAFSLWEQAPVRMYVPVLAERQARRLLRAMAGEAISV